MLRYLLLLALPVIAWPEANWTLAKSGHFELYSQAGPESVRSALAWFESLHAFFAQRTGSKLDGRLPVRVIAFRSRSEYQEYKLRQNADAYYVSLNNRDFIVLPSLNPAAFPLAAHEFAHLAAHASGQQLPPWLSEGLAELYASIQINEDRSILGAERQGHSQLLKRQSWIPMPQLVSMAPGASTTLFYAQSWALTEMLVLSPAYSSKFDQLRTALDSGTPSAQALTEVYAKSMTAIESDLLTWVNAVRPSPMKLPGVSVGDVEMKIAPVAAAESQALIAELLFETGELTRAENLYRSLTSEPSQTAASYAALGTIALRRGEQDDARSMWKRAIELGLTDAALCYHYAVLAEEAGLGADEVRPALQRAISLKPNHEEARYSLAVLESNAGRYEEALNQWRAIRSVRPARAFAYWSAMANAYNELGRREEAEDAAQQALDHAKTSAEVAHARDLAYIAQTDLTVQFASDAEGRTRMVTTRAPHGAPDWNPFIELGDHVQRIEGNLAAVECAGPAIQIVVVSAMARLKLSIQDPNRVQMRNAPAEFTCGLQPVTPVIVDYTAGGVVRGMRFTGLSSTR